MEKELAAYAQRGGKVLILRAGDFFGPHAGNFNATLHEMREMRYLWEQTIEMDNSKLIAFLGHEPQTPLIEAVHATLAGLGCI